MIDLGGHRGAKLAKLYQPTYEEGVWLDNLSGNWEGAAVRGVPSIFKSNPGCGKKEGYGNESSFVKFEQEMVAKKKKLAAGGRAEGKPGKISKDAAFSNCCRLRKDVR